MTAVVAECGLDLVLRLAERDTSLLDRVREQLVLSPPRRLARLLPSDAVREVRRSLRWLADASTPTIVVGQVGAALLGAPQRPDSAQVEFVSADPVASDRELRSDGLVAVDVEDRWREENVREPWTLAAGGTPAIVRHLPGTRDYRDLKRSAEPVDFDGRTRVLVAHPRDLLRIADASARDPERARVPGLQALLEATYQ